MAPRVAVEAGQSPAASRAGTGPWPDRPALHRLVRLLAPRLPRPVRVRLARAVARAVALRCPAQWAAVRANLARIHPGADPRWLKARVPRVFENFGVCLADQAALPGEASPRLWRHVAGAEDQHVARALLAEGRGLVCVTAHLGNWALAGRVLAPLGCRVHLVMAPERDPRVGAVLDGTGSAAVRVVRRDFPLVGLGLVAALRRGEVVACQLDRPTGGRGDVRLPFFGAVAAFPAGPFRLAAAAGVAVVSAYCLLDGGDRYRLLVDEPLEVARGREEAALRRAIGILERRVAAHSDQWFTFFHVWESAA